MDSSTNTFSFDMVLMVPKPGVANPFWNLTKPYSWTVWLATLLTFLVCSVAVRLLEGRVDFKGFPLMFGSLCAQGKT